MGDDLRRVWDKAVRAAQLRNRLPGRLGKPGGAVVVTARPGYLYVRLSSEGGQTVVIARNDGVPRLYDLPVWLELEHNTYVISGVDGTRLEAFLGTADGGGGGVAYHTHATGTGLEYEVEAIRLEPGRVKHFTGLQVQINPFRYWTGTAWQTYTGGILDLTSNKPATAGTHAWVLVGINPATNTAVATTGTAYGYATPLTLDMLDDISFNSYIPLTGIKVRADDTSLSQISKYVAAQAWLDFPGAAADSGHTIQDDGSDETQRANLNFVDGEGVDIVVADDSGNDATTVTPKLDFAGLTEELTIDGVADEAAFYDDSAGTHRKIPPWRFQASRRMIYAATADKTVADTVVETSLFGDGAGTLTIPANSLIAGTVIHIYARGQLGDTGTPTLNIKATLGGTLVCETTATTLTGVTAVEWQLEVTITIRTIGASGSAIGGGLFDYDDGSEVALSSAGAGATIDTTGALDVGLTATWGTANASNTITARESNVDINNPAPGTYTAPTGASGDGLLLETGDYMLLESGDFTLLE